MLKIGSVRWRGKCWKHPLFNPLEEGEGAIKGGCTRCLLLLEIYECHTKLVSAMREFGPVEDRKQKPRATPLAGRQTSLFDELEMQ